MHAKPVLDSFEQRAVDGVAGTIRDGEAALGQAADRITVAITPYQNRPVLPTTPRRRQAFLARLDQIIDAAFRTDPDEASSAAPHDATDQGALLDAACRLCQGSCCVPGGDSNAFLDVEDIQRYRRACPDAGPDEIRAAYLDRLPAETALTSCVYHGAHGCTLERSMRNHVCNDLVCRGQRILSEGRAAGDVAAVMLAAPRDRAVRAAAWSEATGYLVLDVPGQGSER